MHIVAWFVAIGLLIKAGAIIFSYLISINNAEASNNLYSGLDLSAYRRYSFSQYSLIVLYKVLLISIEAYIAFLIIKLLSKLNLEKPFNYKVQILMQKISYSILYLWIIAMVHNTHVQYIGSK